MIELTFAREGALVAFTSMAIGIWETHRDDNEPDTALWSEFTDLLGEAEGLTVTFADHFLRLIEATRDNCDDNAGEMGIHDEIQLADASEDDRASVCCPWEVTMQGSV